MRIPASLPVLILALVASAAGHAEVWYVDRDNASGVQDGASWATAFATVQPAIDAAAPGDELWVAAGVYDEGRVDAEAGRTSGALYIDKALSIFGGFAGDEESIESRDPEANPAVLDGHQALRPAGASPLERPTTEDRANNVVVVLPGVTFCVLDGLTITGGRETAAKVSPPRRGGGGVYWAANAGEIRGCIFQTNVASQFGGAVYAPTGTLLIVDTLFESNQTVDSIGFGYGGGALAGNPDVTVENCTFRRNATNGVGGAVRDAGVVADSLFEGNAVLDVRLPRQGGGAIADVALVSGCMFNGNSAQPSEAFSQAQNARGWGGAGRADVFVNCVFFNNAAGSGGGAIATHDADDPDTVLEGTVEVINCSFYGNVPDDVWAVSRAGRVVNSVLSAGTTATKPVTLTVENSWTSGDPRFEDARAGNLRPRFDSPLIDAAMGEDAPETDIEGVARPQFARPDIGAYEFVAAASPSEVGLIILPSDLGTTNPPPGHYTFPLGAAVTIDAVFGDDRFFAGWEGQVTGGDESLNLELTESLIVRPTFGRLARVTASVVGEGAVEPGDIRVPEGESVQLEAFPAEGWAFVRWDGDVETSANPLTLSNLAGVTAVTAVFRELAPVTIETVGEGNVNLLTPGEDGEPPVPASPPFFVGDTLLIDAAAAPGWALYGWQGDATGDASPLERTLDGPLALTAEFRRLVDVTFDISGDGLVVPGGGAYFEGELVTFEAVPSAGWDFDGWGGGLQGFPNPATFTLSADLDASARFVNPSRLVTAVSGGGWMSPAPGVHVYDTPREVELVAFPDPGWRFVRWEGDVSGTETPLRVFVEDDVAVTAVFAFGSPPPGTVALTLDVEGQGATMPDAGTHVYPIGAEVTLTAMPAEGWTFAEWRADTGTVHTDNPLTLALPEDLGLRAVFVQPGAPFGCVPPTEQQTPAGFGGLLPLAGLLTLACLRRSRNRAPRR